MLRPPLYRNKKLMAGITQGSRQAALDVNRPESAAILIDFLIDSSHLGLVRFLMLRLLPEQVLTVAHSKEKEEQREKSEAKFVMSTYSRLSCRAFPARWIGQINARHLSRPCCPNDKVEPATPLF